MWYVVIKTVYSGHYGSSNFLALIHRQVVPLYRSISTIGTRSNCYNIEVAASVVHYRQVSLHLLLLHRFHAVKSCRCKLS